MILGKFLADECDNVRVIKEHVLKAGIQTFEIGHSSLGGERQVPMFAGLNDFL